MNNFVYIANNKSDLFGDIDISNFDTGVEEVPRPVSDTDVSNEVSPFFTFLLVVIIILCVVVFVAFLKSLKKEKVVSQNFVVPDYEEAIDEPMTSSDTAIKQSKKAYKSKINYETPKNLKKCIRLFLENTRNK